MSEGELKKRIFSEAVNGEIIQHFKEPVEVIELNRLSKILDEAKDEILGLWKNHPCYVAVKQKPNDYTDIGAFYLARDEWLCGLEEELKKWFGMVEKE